MLKDKNILLGITGGIAAYKAANLTRLFVKKGANVKVIMTSAAKEFITPLTMATLSKNPILVDFYNPENGDWNSHVDLGLWADAIVIAPATANSMGKMAHAIADNLLITTYLSARCPVFFAPTMDLDMYQHPATQKNIEILTSYGNHMIEPESGELASGLIGKGRMAEPESIVEYLDNFFSKKKVLSNKRFLITSGPTHEKIDPVRFIGNHSSGKMGFAIANQIAKLGGKVILVSGPTHIKPEHKNITVVPVKSAQEMYTECINHFDKVDVGIMAAAVADYTPIKVAENKIKKQDDSFSITLKKTKDIAKELGLIKTKNQILVGFALETENEEFNALQKLQKKNLDFIVLNSLKDEGAGFGGDTNKVTLFTRNGDTIPFSLKSKAETANDIITQILTLLEK